MILLKREEPVVKLLGELVLEEENYSVNHCSVVLDQLDFDEQMRNHLDFDEHSVDQLDFDDQMRDQLDVDNHLLDQLDFDERMPDQLDLDEHLLEQLDFDEQIVKQQGLQNPDGLGSSHC